MKSTFVFLVTLLAGLGVLTPAAPRAAGTPSPSYHWVCVTPSAPFAPRDAGRWSTAGALWLLGGWNPHDKVHFPKSAPTTSGAPPTARPGPSSNPIPSARTSSTPTPTGKAAIPLRRVSGQNVDSRRRPAPGALPVRCLEFRGRSHLEPREPGPGRPLGAPRPPSHRGIQRPDLVMGGQTTPQFAPAEERFWDDIWSTDDGIHWTKPPPAGRNGVPGHDRRQRRLHGRL